VNLGLLIEEENVCEAEREFWCSRQNDDQCGWSETGNLKTDV